MKFHFGCSASGIPRYTIFYRQICLALRKNDHVIIHDWLEKAIELEKKGLKLPSIQKQEMYKKTAAAIHASDGVILEGTIPSVGIGQQLSLALESDKPTLVLMFDKSKNKSTISDSFIDSSKKHLLSIVKYNSTNLNEVILQFCRQVSEKFGITRINLTLDRSLDGYLEWSAYNKKKSKSQIIREAIIQMMTGDRDWLSK